MAASLRRLLARELVTLVRHKSKGRLSSEQKLRAIKMFVQLEGLDRDSEVKPENTPSPAPEPTTSTVTPDIKDLSKLLG